MSENTTVETPVITPPTPEIKMANRMAQAGALAKIAQGKAVGFAKKRPYFTGALGVVGAAIVGYSLIGGPSKTPVASAGLAEIQNNTRSTGQVKKVEMVVGSYRKTDSLLILNNHKDYTKATMSFMIDLKSAPELATINPRGLVGETVEAKGEYQEYKGKPQIKVTRHENLQIGPRNDKK